MKIVHSVLWDIVTFTGADVGHAGDPFFWETPLGFTCLFTILFTAIITIVSKRIKTDLICDLYNWILIGVCSIAMLHIAEDSNPRYQLQIILFALAIHKLWIVVKSFRGKP